MIVETAGGGVAQGETLLESPVITSEEALNEYLKGGTALPPEGGTGEPPKDTPPAKKVDIKVDPISVTPPTDDDETAAAAAAKKEEEEGAGEPPKEYPSVLHYLNERHQLNLNLTEVKELTKEQEAEALDGLLTRMVEGVNAQLEQYENITQLIQDPEIREVLQAKSEGKSLKDVFAKFAQTPQGMDDDNLALKDFKKRFPKAPDESIQSMVKSLKDSGQFEPFVKSLREQLAEEQSLSTKQAQEAAEAKAKQEAEQEQEEVQRYSQHLQALPAVYGIPLTPEMKEAIFNFTTQRDQKGLTRLDYALQSDDGLILAALGIGFLRQMITNGASIQKNKAKAGFVDKIFSTPDQLQSSGAGNNSGGADPYSAEVLNRF